jgi:hypothetical protein
MQVSKFNKRAGKYKGTIKGARKRKSEALSE